MSDSSFEGMEISLEERVSVFLDEHSYGECNRCVDHEYDQYQSEDEDEDDDPQERALYWDSQYSLLQEILERYSSTGSKLRNEIIRNIDAAKMAKCCDCLKAKTDNSCNDCLRRRVVNMLRDRGINATLCTSNWRNTKKFPRGSHEYIEVIGSTSNRKKLITYVVEVEFRDQFEIAKPCKNYQKILSDLPEYYIGKPEYLHTVVRIVCDAAKRSMTEKRIHMGPWRKTSFMLMKWSANPTINQNLKASESSGDLQPLSLARESHYSQFSVAPPAVTVT